MTSAPAAIFRRDSCALTPFRGRSAGCIPRRTGRGALCAASSIRRSPPIWHLCWLTGAFATNGRTFKRCGARPTTRALTLNTLLSPNEFTLSFFVTSKLPTPQGSTVAFGIVTQGTKLSCWKSDRICAHAHRSRIGPRWLPAQGASQDSARRTGSRGRRLWLLHWVRGLDAVCARRSIGGYVRKA